MSCSDVQIALLLSRAASFTCLFGLQSCTTAQLCLWILIYYPRFGIRGTVAPVCVQGDLPVLCTLENYILIEVNATRPTVGVRQWPGKTARANWREPIQGKHRQWLGAPVPLK